MMLDSMDFMVSNVLQDIRYSSDEEVSLHADFNISLTWNNASVGALFRGALPRSKRNALPGSQNQFPKEPGVYIVYAGINPHYVGIAGVTDSPGTLLGRFRERWRSLREMGFNSRGLFDRCLQSRVHWATVKVRVTNSSSTGIIATRNSSRPRRRRPTGPIRALEAALRITERRLVDGLRTLRPTRGNAQAPDNIQIGSRRIVFNHGNPGNATPAILRALQ